MAEERRRYRFRVWDKQDGRMYPVISMSRGGIVVQDDDTVKTCPRESVELMQYSALKDIDGREIYECDVLEDSNSTASQFKVVFAEGAFRLEAYGDGQAAGVALSEQLVKSSRLKVVGNIFGPAEVS